MANHLIAHWGDVLTGLGGGMFIWSVVGHFVQTFPTPKNVYAQWFIGGLQWAVGQRERATNTFAGQDTTVGEIQRGHQS